MKTTRRICYGQRKGIATLEMVMSFPILAFLIAMMFTVYFATMKKSQLTMEVRHQAWQHRTALDAGKANPFGLLQSHVSGTEREELTRDVASYRNWYPGVPREITWGNVVLTGSWDYRQVEFDDGGFIPIYPHFGVLFDMVTAQGGVNSSPGQVNGLSGLLSFPGL